MRRVLSVLALFSSLVAVVPRPAGAAIVAGFSDTVVTAATLPTAITALPDGRKLVAERQGAVRMLRADGTLSGALTTVPNVCTESERGLLGIAADAAFGSNGYFFVFATVNDGGCVNRVIRYTLTGSAVSSPTVLLARIPSPAGNHNGGDVKVGNDGLLYISVGDGGCYVRDASMCSRSNPAARDLSTLSGKILRITNTGAIPGGNPYVGTGTAPCGATGLITPGSTCQEIYAWGLRNPFRIALDMNSPGSRFFLNDVGQNTSEEIDELVPGADFGWNVREGSCANGSTTDCGAPPAGMTNPLFTYRTGEAGCSSIVGGAFVPSTWPNFSGGAYLYADYGCGKVFQISPSGSGWAQSNFLDAANIVHLEMIPENGDWALYYLSYANGGEIHRVVPERVASPVSPGRLIPRAPTRVLDTRIGLGRTTGDSTISLTLPSDVVPTEAVAVALNVTVTDPLSTGFVTVFPGGTNRPGTSNLNTTVVGETVANAVVTTIGPGRTLSIYAQPATHIVVDVTGYFLPTEGSADGRFVPVDPNRLLDTRSGAKPGAGAQLDLQITGQGGVPSTGAEAVALIVTTTEAGAAGFVTVWPTGLTRPVASTVNPNYAGDIRSNLAIVPLGTGGKVSLYTQTSSHLVVDVAGYFTDSTASVSQSGLYQAINPARVLDSREPVTGPRWRLGEDREVSAASVLQRPGVAVLYNLTATNTSTGGFLTAHASNLGVPLASNVNFDGPDRNRAALAITTLAGSPVFKVFANVPTDVIVDVSGFFLA